MKTFMTVAILAALTLSAAAFGQDPMKGNPTEPTKSETPKAAGKPVTLEELGQMLHGLGYETKPFNDKDGKLIGYSVAFQSDNRTIYGAFQITADGRIWLTGNLAPVADESTPPAVLLAMLEVNDRVFPAYLVYMSKTKKFEIVLPITNGNVCPVTLRTSIDAYVAAVKATVNTWSKAVAVAKEKAEGEPAKPRQ